MLGFLTTDAQVPPALLHRALVESARDTFNAITVDGECSTNDCVVRAGVRRERRGDRRGALPGAVEGLLAVSRELAHRHRPRRRGRDQADRRSRPRRADGRRCAARRQDHRQLAAGQDGGARRRSELGSHRRRRGTRRGRSSTSTGRRCTSAASLLFENGLPHDEAAPEAADILKQTRVQHRR